MTLNEKQLENIINFTTEDKYAILFTNTSNELMDSIKESLKDNINITNIIIDMREINLSNYELVIKDIPKELDSKYISKKLFESIIYGNIIKDLYNIYPNIISKYIDINKFNNNMNATKYSEIDLNEIIFRHHLDFIVESLKRDNISITINVFIDENIDYMKQRSLNDLLNDRYSFYTRFYTNNELKTYYDTSDVFIEEMHDYHERDLSKIKNKLKIK